VLLCLCGHFSGLSAIFLADLSGLGGFEAMSQLDFAKIKELAESYKPDMTRFLRDMIRLPSESCQEKAVVERIREEMQKVEFDKVEIDPMGNVLGTIGNGKHMIAMDAHIDTVGVGNKDNWEFDPYEGYEDEEVIGGRGSSDQEGGMASMVYAGKIIKDLGLEGDYTMIVVGTVQEEDCDGLCWQYIINESELKPEFVVSTEPTDGGIEVKGVSAHGSAPERGDNAIFKMGHILSELEELHGRLKTDDFLGKGSLTVSEIFYTSPSRCAVADGCTISIDRRLTTGEDKELALRQIRDLPAAKAANAQVSMYPYDKPSYTGLVYPTDCYFPSWVIPEDHLATQSAVATYRFLFDEEPRVNKWTFSTNGVAIMGMFGIPCVGFGPGKESEAHAPNEKTWKADLVRCAALYAALPLTYLARLGS
jgi:putative selenium metabolism hydrolase